MTAMDHRQLVFIPMLLLSHSMLCFSYDETAEKLDESVRVFQEKLRAATQPIYADQLKVLKEIQLAVMKKGDLDSANRIQTEIQNLEIAKLRDNLINRVFVFRRNFPGSPKLKLLADGKIAGSDHPNETTWAVSNERKLVIHGADGQLSSTFDEAASVKGLLRFKGTPRDGEKHVLGLEEISK